MNKTKRTISLFLSLVMLLSTMSAFGFTAQAATPSKATITIKGNEYNSSVKAAVAEINSAREYYGYPKLTIDQNLTKNAKTRAKQYMLYYDVGTCPNGASVGSTYLSGYTHSCVIADYGYDTVDADKIVSAIYELKYDYEDFRSVGIGTFAMKNYYGDWKYVVYAVAASDYASAVQTNFDNKSNVSAKISVKTSLMTPELVSVKSDNDHLRYKYAVMLNFNSSVISNINATSQFKLTSSNTKVMKPKDGYVYTKGNGKYKLYVAGKNTTSYKVKVDEGTISGFSNSKHTVKAKSSKKKQMKVSWNYVFKDITGYQIQYSTSSKFKNAKSTTVKGKKNTSKTIKKLKSKKTYYVRVRAYIDQGNGEKIYTKWSKTVKVKVK